MRSSLPVKELKIYRGYCKCIFTRTTSPSQGLRLPSCKGTSDSHRVVPGRQKDSPLHWQRNQRSSPSSLASFVESWHQFWRLMLLRRHHFLHDMEPRARSSSANFAFFLYDSSPSALLLLHELGLTGTVLHPAPAQHGFPRPLRPHAQLRAPSTHTPPVAQLFNLGLDAN